MNSHRADQGQFVLCILPGEYRSEYSRKTDEAQPPYFTVFFTFCLEFESRRFESVKRSGNVEKSTFPDFLFVLNNLSFDINKMCELV